MTKQVFDAYIPPPCIFVNRAWIDIEWFESTDELTQLFVRRVPRIWEFLYPLASMSKEIERQTIFLGRCSPWDVRVLLSFLILRIFGSGLDKVAPSSRSASRARSCTRSSRGIVFSPISGFRASRYSASFLEATALDIISTVLERASLLMTLFVQSWINLSTSSAFRLSSLRLCDWSRSLAPPPAPTSGMTCPVVERDMIGVI